MRSIWKASNLGFALMTLSPVLALGFGWEAFFPVAIASVLGGAVCLAGKSMSTHMAVGQLTAVLVQDLVSAEKDRRDLVLAQLDEAEANWFLAELPRAEAELRRRRRGNQADWRTSARWAWRLSYS
jgi:hypothetical protein